MAYGSPVAALAAGTVTFAGERGGYGTTVVVDHGNGRETLFAHLSSFDVRVGDQVDAGQIIARSGNSGRSTGAHLHVEVREGGPAGRSPHRRSRPARKGRERPMVTHTNGTAAPADSTDVAPGEPLGGNR